MARPKTTRHTRGGTLAILLRILVVVAGLSIFMLWRPLGELVPSASTITANAVQIASDAVNNNGILNSILPTTTKSDGTGSGGGIGGGGDGSDYVDYDTTTSDGDSKEEEEDNKEKHQEEDNSSDDRDYADYDDGSNEDEQPSTSSSPTPVVEDNATTNDQNDYSSQSSGTLSGSVDASVVEEEIDRINRERDAAKTAAAKTADLPKVDGPFFTCPDGRIGLHVIHMPLLLGQTMEKGAAGVFMAGRMIMFRDFALPSLARQTNQNFVAYVSYDPDQDSAFAKAAQEALKTQIQGNDGDSAFVYVADNPRYFINKPDKMLAFPRVANLLAEHQVVSRKDVKSVTLYVTSKMDSDDAVHKDAVKLIQQEACARVGPEESERVLAVRIGPKLAWFPHANTTYGVLAKASEDIEPDQREIIRRQITSKPHLQSVAVDVSLMLCQSPLNCYTATGESDPASILADLSTAEDCLYDFNADKNVLDLQIPGAIAGALYSRPPKFGDAASIPLGTEFSIDLLQLDSFTPIPFDLEAITGCGIVPGELSATNLLLASVYAEAPYVSGLSSADAQGWGAVGGMVAAPAPPSQYDGNEGGGEEDGSGGGSGSGVDRQQGDGFDEEETAVLDAGSMDDDHEGEDGEQQSADDGDYDAQS